MNNDLNAISKNQEIFNFDSNVQLKSPDSSYSCGTKTLIITSIALFAISITSAAILVTISAATLGTGGILLLSGTVVAGLALGIFTAIAASNNQNNMMAERELDFAKQVEDEKIRLKYLDQASARGNEIAMTHFYAITENNLLKALNESDDEKIEEALRWFEKSADNAIGGIGLVSQYFTKMNYDIKTRINELKRSKQPRATLSIYWKKITKDSFAKMDGRPGKVHWEPFSSKFVAHA